MSRIRALAEMLRYVWKHGPDLLADRCDLLMQDIHSPEDYEWRRENGATEFVCQLDHKPWPCDEWTAAGESLAARKAAR